MKHPTIVLALLAVKAFAAAPTFNSDIAPILYQHCATCHRPGQVAPFPLLEYRDAAKRAGLIATVTAKHLMPPWKAEPGYGHFLDELRGETSVTSERCGGSADGSLPLHGSDWGGGPGC